MCAGREQAGVLGERIKTVFMQRWVNTTGRPCRGRILSAEEVVRRKSLCSCSHPCHRLKGWMHSVQMSIHIPSLNCLFSPHYICCNLYPRWPGSISQWKTNITCLLRYVWYTIWAKVCGYPNIPTIFDCLHFNDSLKVICASFIRTPSTQSHTLSSVFWTNRLGSTFLKPGPVQTQVQIRWAKVLRASLSVYNIHDHQCWRYRA